MGKIKSTLKKLYEIAKTISFFIVLISLTISGLISISPDSKETKEKQTHSKSVKPEIKADAFYLPKEYKVLKDIQRKGYEQLLAQGKCPTLHYADISSSKGTPQDPVLYYTCENNGQEGNIFLKVSDIKNETTQVAKAPQERWSMNQCEDFLKKKLNHPSTLNSTTFKTRTWNNGRREIYMKGKAKNSFNLEVKVTGECLFIPENGQFKIEGAIKEER